MGNGSICYRYIKRLGGGTLSGAATSDPGQRERERRGG